MGKPTGFMEYTRVEAGHRPCPERIRDYDEFLLPPDREEITRQSARCMDCGVPFCHAGFVVEGSVPGNPLQGEKAATIMPGPHSIGCPLMNLIPEINDLVYRGGIEVAYRRLSRTHPFPEITGRVCPALCEGSCTLGEHEPPVTVKDIERFVADEMLAAGKVTPRVPRESTGKRVAVVGSGPAGLACADLLNALGDDVTVFERADRPGGFLMYGIPGMKLEKSLVLNRVRLLEEAGVTFRLSTEIGADYPVLNLMREFDAIVLCAGARAERTITAPGHDLPGVVTAVDYLSGVTKSLLDSGFADGRFVSAAGKDVVIVGGGDTGTDCVATAIRQGAKSVTQLEIMPKPPEERAESNPWPLWPKIHRTDYGHHEAKAVFGADPREYNTTVKEIRGDRESGVTSVLTVEVEWQKQSGRLVPVEISGSERERPAGLVLSAMGFTGPEKALIEQLDLAVDARGNVKTEEGGHRSSLMTVFAAGDMRRGPSLVVWAILEGRRAAEECHGYLAGH